MDICRNISTLTLELIRDHNFLYQVRKFILYFYDVYWRHNEYFFKLPYQKVLLAELRFLFSVFVFISWCALYVKSEKICTFYVQISLRVSFFHLLKETMLHEYYIQIIFLIVLLYELFLDICMHF